MQLQELLAKVAGRWYWDWCVPERKISGNSWLFEQLGMGSGGGPFPIPRLFRRVHPEDFAATRAAVEKVLREPDSHLAHDYRLVFPDGAVRWFRMCGKAVEKDPAGNVVRVVGDNIDLELVKSAEADVHRMQATLEAVVNAIPQRIWWKDLAGRYLGANTAFANDAGLASAQYMIGKSDFDMPWAANGEAYVADDLAVVESGSPRLNIEEANRAADGSLRWVRTSKIPLRIGSGAIFGTVGTFTDITLERRRIDALRKAITAAEAANRAKSEFLANMSHEIRTPMNGILGMTELALSTPLNVQQRGYLETVRSSGQSLLTIINDILDFSKIEAGKISLSPAAFDFRVFVDRCTSLLSIRASEKGQVFEVIVADNVPRFLLGDEVRLGQVLLNLLGNAVKFTPAHGRVTLWIDAESHRENAVRLSLRVRDTGIGIAPEKLQSIFDPFEQADGSTTRQFGGTGLGLTITRRLLELMNGGIQVESQIGIGTCFTGWCIMETAENAAPVAASHLPNEPLAQGLRVLLVEDNSVNRKLATGLLEREGCQVSVCIDGKEAVEVLCDQAKPFDLVLMDCQMPRLNGYDATRALRAWEVGRSSHTRVVAMTASAMEGDRERCLAAGMDGYVTKPLDLRLFRAVLHEAFAAAALNRSRVPLPAESPSASLEKLARETAQQPTSTLAPPSPAA